MIFLVLLLVSAGWARDLPQGAAWRWEFEHPVSAPLVKVGKILVVPTEDKVWGIHSETGQELWSTKPTSAISPDGLALEHQGMAIFSSRQGLIAIDGATGQERWAAKAEQTSSRLCLGRIVVIGADGTLQALDPSTGALRWRSPEAKYRTLAVDGARILAATQETVELWDLTQGKRLWQQKSDGVETVDLGTVALSLGNDLVARETATGKTLWRQTQAESTLLVGDRVFVETGSELVAMTARTGQKLWKSPSYSDETCASGPNLLVSRGYEGVTVREQKSGRVLRQLRGAYPGLSVGSEFLLAGTEGQIFRLDSANNRFLPGYRGVLSPNFANPGMTGLAIDGRRYLPVDTTLIALGDGPGTVVMKGAPELRLGVDSPRTPGKIEFALEGKFVRTPEIRLYRWTGPLPKELSKLSLAEPTLRHTVPITAGANGVSETVELKVSEPGNYIVEAASGSTNRRTALTVTTMGVTAKVAPGQFLVQVMDALKGSPLAGVFVEVSQLGDKSEPGLSGTTDPQGLFRIDTALGLDQATVLRLRHGKEDVTFEWFPQQFSGTQKIFLQTDRSLYRPHHEVFFQGMIGTAEGEKSRLSQGLKVGVEIRDSADNALTTQELVTDEYGSFSGRLKLGAEPPLGRYRLSAWLVPEQPTSLPFEVQEYRKPSFEVSLKAKDRLVKAGQSLHFDLSAKTFFGAPVPGAKVKVTVRRAELSGKPSLTSPGYHSYADFVSEEDLTLDPQGGAAFTVPTEKGDRDAEYLVDVEVTGPTGQVVEGSGSGLAVVAPYGVYLRGDGWMGYPGKPLRVAVETLDRLGRPVPALVKLKVESPWPKNRLLGEPVVKTGANGKTELLWTPKSKDGPRIVVSVQGTAHEPQEVSFYLYDEAAPDESGRELLAEKSRLKVGETARLLFKSRVAGSALLTLEGREMFLVRPFTAKKGAQFLEFPIEERYAPGLTANVAILEDGFLRFETVDLVIPDEAHKLSLKVEADQPKYRPGETAHLTLTATDAAGQPVDALATLAVVDEALLALSGDQVPAIHTTFFGPQANRVQTFVMEPRRSEVAGFQTVPAPTQVRKDFKDTAFWKPDVMIRGGKAEVAVPLPDNLTRWRATSRAATTDLEVGQGVGGLVTDLPLMVQAALPRYFVEGDSVDAVAVVSNRTERARDLRVELSATPGVLEMTQDEITALPPDGQKRVISRLTVEENVLGKAPLPEKLELQVEARTSDSGNPESDAEQISVPILPFGSPYGKGAGGLLKAGDRKEILITRPRGLLKPKAELRISGTPLAAVQGALKYLADYPYGCVEQTMNRFMPTVVASQAMSQMGLPSQDRAALTPMVEQGLARLYHYQHSDGGWGWWEDDPTNPYLTGYVISGLVAAQEAGYPISETVLNDGVRAAERILALLDPAKTRPLPETATKEEKKEAEVQAEADRETRIYLAWALTRAGKAPLPELTLLTEQAEQLGTYAVALLALSWQDAGAPEKSLPLVHILEERAKEAGTGVSWPSQSALPYSWTDDDVEVSALAMRAILAVKPESSTVAGAVPWLLSQREGAQWKSTRDTAQVVLALLDLARRQPAGPTGTLQVRWDGELLQTMTLDATESVVKVPEEALAVAPAGGHRLELIAEGSPAVMSWKFSGFLKESEKVDLPGESEGLRLTRTYVVEQPGQLLRHNRVTPPEILRVEAGQEVEVELEFELPHRMQYLKLEDPRPAGFEVIPNSHTSPSTPSRQEDRDAFSVFFFTELAAGKHTVTYRLRAETPGDLRSLPARIELMYRPSVYGASASQRVHVARYGEAK